MHWKCKGSCKKCGSRNFEIEVIREGYKTANLGSPDGIVWNFNFSNVVQSKGEKGGECNEKSNDLNLL
ncbi:hypothetical protein COE15_07665 [Bacillus cereus]|nr:hypothetical protein CN288_24170 [Bacillus sp. AFS023182]PGY02826.1 hypothetical protein COE15_07665 [Bacillus cereus]